MENIQNPPQETPTPPEGNMANTPEKPQSFSSDPRELIEQSAERNEKVEKAQNPAELAQIVASFDAIPTETDNLSGETIARRIKEWSSPKTIPTAYGIRKKYLGFFILFAEKTN